MSKFINKIKDLELETWIKYWIYRTSGGGNYKFALSDIKEGTNFYLENTIKRKFNMFELFGKTTQDGTPTPENPIPIINITGNINEKIQNANLFDLKSYLIKKGATYTENDDGSYTFTLKQSMYSEPLEFSDENIVVSLSGLITNVTSNNFRIQLLNKNNGSAGFIDENTQVLNNKTASKLRFDWSDSQGGTVTIKNIMLNKGTTALPYIPHAEQNISFPLEEGQIVTQNDYIDDDGIHHKKWHEVLDGVNKKIDLAGSFNNINYGGHLLDKLSVESTNTIKPLCSHLLGIRNGQVIPGYCYVIGPGTRMVFTLTDQTITTVQAFNEWLQEQYNNGTPLEIEYELAEEVVEPFTVEQAEAYNKIKELYTYNEITNIDGNANLKIKYWERVER